MTMRRPPVTMELLAARLGVSKSTVSKALNPHAWRSDVGSELSKRIRATAAELGYRPDWRSHVPERRLAVALVSSNEGGAPYISGVYAELPALLARHLAARDHDLVLLPMPAGQTWRATMRGRSLDACIVMQPAPVGLDAELAAGTWPAVWFNQTTSQPLDQLLPDDAGAVTRCVELLYGLGHRRFAYIDTGDHGHYAPALRRAAFAEALTAHGLRGPALTPEAVPAAVRAGTTGLVACDDLLAVHALRACHEALLACPARYSLVSPAGCAQGELAWPAISGVLFPIYQLAATAVEWILAGQSTGGPRLARVPGELVRRASTAPPPA